MSAFDFAVAGGGGLLGYAEKTSNTSITATVEASSDVVVTAPAVVLDGSTLIRVEVFSAVWISPSAQTLVMCLFGAQDAGAAASLGFIGQWNNTTGSTGEIVQAGGVCTRYLTPAAGSWVYSLRGHVFASGTGTVAGGAGGAGANVPTYIAVAVG